MSNLPILFLVLLLLAVPTHQQEQQLAQLITKTCDQTLYKDFCKTNLGSAPQTDVKDLPSLTKYALKMASLKAGETYKQIEALEASTQDDDEFMQQALNDCAEVYQDAIDQLESSTVAVDAKGSNDVNTWVTAAMVDVNSCEDGFKENKEVKPPLTEVNTQFSQLCSIILTMSKLLAKN